jgi:Fic family protein
LETVVKTPAPPPDFDALLDKLMQSNRAVEALTTPVSPLTDEYLPWDKLRFKTPPGSLTTEEWWITTRMNRRSIHREIPQLVTMNGTAFKFALPDEVLREVDYVNRNASGTITLSEQVTNPKTRNRYIISSLIEEAITSSQLEGASTTRRVAKEMIRSGREPRNRSETMIFNNYRAMQRVTELRNESLTPDLICKIHRIVTAGTLDNPEAAGVVQRDDEERVSVWGDGDQLLHKPPPVSELNERMDALCRFANDTGATTYMPPVLRAMTIHFMMGYDHYFEDGNGRTARAVFYWSMLNQGYWLTEFITISKILKAAPAQYARSFLLTEQDDGDLTYFYIFNLGIMRRAIGELHDYLARKAEELREAQLDIRSNPGEFNYRQLSLLEHAIRNPSISYTARSHATSHGVTHETARQDLMSLEGKHLLRKVKVGRQYVWQPVDNLAERLKKR